MKGIGEGGGEGGDAALALHVGVDVALLGDDGLGLGMSAASVDKVEGLVVLPVLPGFGVTV